jgi:hypothetical protein
MYAVMTSHPRNSTYELPRKATAMGMAGQMGQLFTVYEKNWHCLECGQENYASRPRCQRCRKQRPAGHEYVQDPALAAMQAGAENPWQEVIDPASKQLYYYNKVTGQTQWERPEEMGPAPMATGWFGRGAAGSSAAQQYAQLCEWYLQRPARKQKDFIDPKKYHIEGAQEYNIWYGRYIGDVNDKRHQEPAEDRCCLEKDAGYTKADTGSMGVQSQARVNKRFFCLHFARGMCAKGHECTYFHRIPTPEDDAKCEEMTDCFGRSRHSVHRDDMNGVGSFMNPCRTLFVGNLTKHKYPTAKALEEAMWKHFGEWGELENLNVVHRLSIAFPRYRLRTSAEFAKEAMAGQKLDRDEVLSIRWAHDDPNPVAQDAINRADKDAIAALFQAKGISLAQTNYEYPAGYRPPAESAALPGVDGNAAELAHLAYPNTDAQYPQESGAAPHGSASTQETSSNDMQPGSTEMSEAEYIEYCKKHYGAYFDVSSSASETDPSSLSVNTGKRKAEETESMSDSTKKKLAIDGNVAGLEDGRGTSDHNDDDDDDDDDDDESEDDDDDEDEDPEVSWNGWSRHTDPDTGATYYYHKESLKSSWEMPEGFVGPGESKAAGDG